MCIYSVKDFHKPSAHGYSQHYGFLLCALVSLCKLPVPLSSSSPQNPLITYKVKKKKKKEEEIKDEATQKAMCCCCSSNAMCGETVKSLKGLHCKLIWSESNCQHRTNLPRWTAEKQRDGSECGGGLSDPKVSSRSQTHMVTIKPHSRLHSQKYTLPDPGQARIMRKKTEAAQAVTGRKKKKKKEFIFSFVFCF